MEEEDDDADFIIEEFLENLDWSEEEDAEASEDEIEEAEVYLTEDPFLTKIYDFLTEKFPFVENKSQEDSGYPTIEEIRSVGIIELKEAGESQELKDAHDLEAFGMSVKKDFDDLLLQIATVEPEWNALIAVFSVQEDKEADKKFVKQEDEGTTNEGENVIGVDLSFSKANIQDGLIPIDLGGSRGSHRRRQLIDTYVHDLGNSISLMNVFSNSVDG